MNESVKTLEFGKKYCVGNFNVIKINKVLNKHELESLRNQEGIPEHIRKHLKRAQLPYIKIQAISGIWSIEFCCGAVVFNAIDTLLAAAIEAEEKGEKLELLGIDWRFESSLDGYCRLPGNPRRA